MQRLFLLTGRALWSVTRACQKKLPSALQRSLATRSSIVPRQPMSAPNASSRPACSTQLSHLPRSQLSSSAVANPLRWYLGKLRTHPHCANMITSATLMFIGDTLAQLLEQSRKEEHRLHGHLISVAGSSKHFPDGVHIDATRSAVLMGWSGCMGALFTTWFKRMDVTFAALPRVTGVLAKVGMTAFVLSPVTTAAFLALVTAVEHILMRKEPPKTVIHAAKKKLQYEYENALVGSWTFWSPVNFTLWMFAPAHLRVAIGGVAATMWNIYLSIIQHRRHHHRQRSAEEKKVVMREQDANNAHPKNPQHQFRH